MIFCFIISLKFYFLSEICLIASVCVGIILNNNSLYLNLFYIDLISHLKLPKVEPE